MKVIYNTSDSYAYYTGVSILSFLENNFELDDIEYYIIDAGMKKESICNIGKIFEKYKKKYNVLILEDIIKEIKNNYSLNILSHNGSNNIWVTVFPNIIFPDYKGLVLYIDSDTIVNGSIKELLEIDWNGKTIAGVNGPKINIEENFLSSSLENMREEISIIKNRGNAYLNSGFIIYNMENYYINDIDKKTQEVINLLNVFIFKDQTVINAIYNRLDVIELDLKYNSYFHTFPKYSKRILVEKKIEETDINDAINNPVIIHYLGHHSRPWLSNSTSNLVNIYDKYVKLLPFDGQKKESFFRSEYFIKLNYINKVKFFIIVKLYNTRLFGFLLDKKHRYK